MGKSTISMAISNSYVTNYQRVIAMFTMLNYQVLSTISLWNLVDHNGEAFQYFPLRSPWLLKSYQELMKNKDSEY